jgi:UDP-2,3-diacylglucosamine pyrophosphatase LpxH
MTNRERAHEILGLIKNLASDMGCTPTLSDIIHSKMISKHELYKVFGGYTQLIHAAGLSPRAPSKIDSTIFQKDISSHLEEYEPREKTPHLDIKFTKTIILGDVHAPFTHKGKLEKAIEFIKTFKPARVIQVGDLYDMLSHGKFARSMNIYTPAQEMAEGRKVTEKLWKDIQKASPGVECHQILGNHDARPMKRILETYPEAEVFLDFSKWFTFDGVRTQFDIREELILDGIAYIHGYKSKLGEHMEFMRRPVVCGHSHRPGLYYKNYGDATLFEMNVGFLGDPESKALSYTPQRHSHWSHAVGAIDEHGPRLVML